MKNVKMYLEKNTRIKSSEGFVPFKLNDVQNDLLDVIDKNSKTIVLKARQLGITTGVIGYFYYDTITNPNVTTGLIGYSNDMCLEMFDKIKTLWKSTSVTIRPRIIYQSKHEILFPETNSRILIVPSDISFGKDIVLNNILASEISAWENAEKKITDIRKLISEDGKLVIESSPNKMEEDGKINYFYKLWSEENNYAKKEYDWCWGYNKKEIETIKERMNNSRQFSQEYKNCFLAPEKSMFDLSDNKKKKVLKPIKIENGLKIYKKPNKKDSYVTGCTVSFSGDSVAVILNRKTGEEVALYKEHIAPDSFGEKLNVWGRKYNNALIVLEINNHGQVTMLILKQKHYPTIYCQKSIIGGVEKLGWKTTKNSKMVMLDELSQEELIIHSKEILDEMSVFNLDDNRSENSCIIAIGIALQGIKTLIDEERIPTK